MHTQGRGWTEESRAREQIARILDRMILKLEEKERKDKVSSDH
jgi:hypothetical protein